MGAKRKLRRELASAREVCGHALVHPERRTAERDEARTQLRMATLVLAHLGIEVVGTTPDGHAIVVERRPAAANDGPAPAAEPAAPAEGKPN